MYRSKKNFWYYKGYWESKRELKFLNFLLSLIIGKRLKWI